MKNLLIVRSRAILCFLLLALLSLSLTSQPAHAAFTISYANLVGNQVLSGTFKVVVTASDISQVANIKLYIDGLFFKTENNSPYEFNINTANYLDGARILKAVATDKLGNTNAATATVSVVFDNNVVIVMNDTTSSTGQSVWSGRPVHAEHVTDVSVLVGKQINSISLKLKKNNSPSGIAEIGIINNNQSMKKVFGTISVSTLSTSHVYYHFALSGECYTIQAGDRIGIKYTDGTSSVNISIMRDTNTADPFDGTKTRHTTFTSQWNLFTSVDLTMTLKMIGACGTLPTAEQVYNTETFNVPDGVSHFILLIPNEAHEPNSSPNKFIATTNRHYLAANLQIAQNTAITMINDDGGHTHTTQAKRQDSGVIVWTSSVIGTSQYSTPPHSFTDLTQYDIVDTVYPSMTGTVTVRAATIDPSGQIVGCMYVPTSQLNTFRTLLTNNGFIIESVYSFTYDTIAANFSDNNTLIVYSTNQPLSTALSALSTIVQQTPYT